MSWNSNTVKLSPIKDVLTHAILPVILFLLVPTDCLSYFCLLMSRTAIAVSMNSEFTIATIQEHHKFWCPAGAIGLTGGLGSIFVLCEDL